MKDQTVKRAGPPKSMQQMIRETAAAEAAEGRDIWACPACGCKDWRIANSHEWGGPRKRQRICRHCGHEMPTQEVPVPEGYTLKAVPRDDAQ